MYLHGLCGSFYTCVAECQLLSAKCKQFDWVARRTLSSRLLVGPSAGNGVQAGTATVVVLPCTCMFCGMGPLALLGPASLWTDLVEAPAFETARPRDCIRNCFKEQIHDIFTTVPEVIKIHLDRPNSVCPLASGALVNREMHLLCMT
jgi:hypothetical protein